MARCVSGGGARQSGSGECGLLLWCCDVIRRSSFRMDAKAALGVVGAGRRCAEGAGRWQRHKLVAAVLALLA